MKLKVYESVKRTKSIEGQRFEIINGYSKISDLQFWEENPRIFSLLEKERLENTVSKNIIFEKMSLFPDFDKLKEQIRKDELINEPLWVCKNPKTKDYTVYEGNTRLAVAIQLSENDKPSKRALWNKIPVNVLPDGTDERVIKRLIGLIHLVGVNAWAPFEADGYYYREVEDLKEEGESVAEACKIVGKTYGVTASKVKNAHKLVTFMMHHNMSSNVQKNYYSYWQTINASGPLLKVRKVFNNPKFLKGKVEKPRVDALDKLLIKKVKSGEEVHRVSGSSSEGTAFRDDIKIISNAFNENQDIELITDLIDEKITIQRAVERAKEGGIGNTEYEKIKDFADWLCSTQTMKNLQNAVINFPEMKAEVATIIERSEIATLKLEENLKKKVHILDNSNQNHLMYKICILMMLADRLPHPSEIEKTHKILTSEKWLIDLASHDIIDAIEQVSREIYKYNGVEHAANIYGKLLTNIECQKNVLRFIEEIMIADGVIKKEETKLIKQLRELWKL